MQLDSECPQVLDLRGDEAPEPRTLGGWIHIREEDDLEGAVSRQDDLPADNME